MGRRTAPAPDLTMCRRVADGTACKSPASTIRLGLPVCAAHDAGPTAGATKCTHSLTTSGRCPWCATITDPELWAATLRRVL